MTDLFKMMDAADDLIKLLGLEVDSLAGGEKRKKAYDAKVREALDLELVMERLPGGAPWARAIHAARDHAAKKAPTASEVRASTKPKELEAAFKKAADELEKVVARARKERVALEKKLGLDRGKGKLSAKELKAKAKKKEEYESRVRLIRRIQTDLRGQWMGDTHGPTSEALKQAGEDVKAARTYVEKKDKYDEPCKSLAKTEKDLKAAAKALKSAVKTLHSTHKELMRDWQTASTKLDESNVLPVSLGGDLRDRLDDAIAPLLRDPMLSKEKVAEVTVAVKAAVSAVYAALREAAARREACNTKLEAARHKLHNIRYATAEELQPAHRVFRRLESENAGGDYDRFDGTLTDFDKAVEDARVTAAAAHAVWVMHNEKRLATLREQCKTHAAAVHCEFAHKPDILRRGLEKLEADVKGEVLAFVVANTRLDELVGWVDENERRLKDFTALKQVLQPVDSRMREIFEEVEDKLSRLDSLCEENGYSLPEKNPFADKLEALEKAWSTAVGSAYSLEMVDEREHAKQANALIAEIDDVLENPDQLRTFQGDSEADEAEKRFREAEAAYRDQYVVVLSNQAKDLPQWERRRKEIGDRFAELRGWKHPQSGFMDDQTTKLTELTKELRGEALRLAELIRLQRVHAKMLVAGITEDLATAREIVEKKKKSVKGKRYVDGLHNELMTHRGMAQSSILPILEEAIASLSKLAPEAKKAATSKTGMPADMKALEKRVIQAKRLLKDKALKAFRPGVAKSSSLSWQELRDGLPAKPLSQSEAALQKWEDQIRLELRRAAEDKKAYEEWVKGDYASATSAFKKQKGAFKLHKELYSSMVVSLKNQKTMGKVEGQLESAKSEVKTLMARLKMYLEHPEKLLAASQKVLDDKVAAEKQDATFDGMCKAFDREVTKPLATAMKPHKGGSGKVNEIAKLFAQAKKLYKKDKDMRMGKHRLEVARRRANFFMTFPEGEQSAALSKLPKFRDNFKSAVQAFDAAVGNLSTAFGNLEGADDRQTQSVRSAMKRQLDELLTFFARTAFDAPVAAVMELKLPPAKRAEAREQAMQRIRDYRGMLGDPRIMALAKHPFQDVPEFKAHYAVGKALLELERTLRVSVDMSNKSS